MTTEAYVDALERKLSSLAGIVTTFSLRREFDLELGFGLIEGSVIFFDGSRFELVEQVPVTRRKYRLHYMSAAGDLIVRWDSAPHHRTVSTFPFHKHTKDGVQAHPAVTALDALDQILALLPS